MYLNLHMTTFTVNQTMNWLSIENQTDTNSRPNSNVSNTFSNFLVVAIVEFEKSGRIYVSFYLYLEILASLPNIGVNKEIEDFCVLPIRFRR